MNEEGEILFGVAEDGHREGGGASLGAASPFENLRARTVIPWVILGSIVLGLAFFVVAAVVAALTPLEAGGRQTFDVLFGLALYLALASWIVWVCRRSDIGLRRLVGTLPGGYGGLSWVRLAGLLVVTMGFSIGSWLVWSYALSTLAPGVFEFVLEAVSTEPDPTLVYQLSMTLLAVIAAPVLEEAFFRGILVNRWGHRWGVPTALIVSSIAFGILHANPLGIGIVGLVAALLYLRTRTLIVPIVFHAANNLVGMLGEFLSDASGPLDIAAEIQAARDDLVWGVILVAVSLPILVWYIRRYWPARDAALPYMAHE
ncbi:CPBP family intramembrane glutamic endopeptidase [Candidatus Palauibacter sp.]|uniref:CPBP family intramembrane glutamic endopeptidase n=1 Tax=Candidatus Palauibacter sp. TaxID=3101350 RepID=UPI003B026E0B